MNYLSLPASAQQHNRKSHYGRWVRRIPQKQKYPQPKAGGMSDKQKEFFLKQDKHFIMKKHYAPLSIEDFNVCYNIIFYVMRFCVEITQITRINIMMKH